jgi:tetratricopeptide (TPR) repeat protein
MKTQYLICFFFLLTAYSLFAQEPNNILRGRILFLSSNNTPAVGVKVSGTIQNSIYATTQYTTDKGTFDLIFSENKPGAKVQLEIGNIDRHGTKLEVVNAREVAQCQISDDATEEFQIIVCKKGTRDEAAQRYYKIIKSSSDAELAKSKKELNNLYKAAQKNYEQIAFLASHIIRLERQNDSLTIYREAYRIASINKDNASKRVLRYIQMLDEGKSVQEARTALSIPLAAKDLRESSDGFQKAIIELDSIATAAITLSDYRQAIISYYKIIKHLEQQGIDTLNIADYYSKIAEVYIEDKNYRRALDYSKKRLNTWEKRLPPYDERLIQAYHQLGKIYEADGDTTNATFYFKKGSNLSVELQSPEFISEKGLQYLKNEQYLQAHAAFSECQRRFPKSSTTYQNWAAYYAQQVNPKEGNDKNKEFALDMLREALDFGLGYKDVLWIKENEAFNKIRNDEVFKKLIKSIGP